MSGADKIAVTLDGKPVELDVLYWVQEEDFLQELGGPGRSIPTRTPVVEGYTLHATVDGRYIATRKQS